MSRSLWILLTPFLPLLAALPGGRWLFPLLAPLTLYPSFAERVRERDYFKAWQLGIAWAALLSAGVIALVFWLPDAARAGILNGEAYREEMFTWVNTGVGRENDWRAFLPTHASHFAIFLVLTWLSGGYLGLVLGAVLMGYMSYFVGSYAVESSQPVLGCLAAWVPWSVLRVLAYVLFGTVFARPLLVRRIWPFEREELKLMALAASGLVADVLIKAFFAPGYGIFLRQIARNVLP
ncbi:MAG TPA: hypothetical protein VKM72_20545 [Thermoanaerobaculia bacterium]|nr:hypothetical protein [Thermoanaerobaculia bacterium]